MTEPLLPPSLATDPRFAALESLTGRLSSLDLLPLLVYLVDVVDPSALPYLAEQFSLIGADGWTLAETESARRALISSAIELHSHKGTPFAIREVFRLLGLGEVVIEEGRSGYCRDGTRTRDGFSMRGEKHDNWAEYRILTNRLLSVQQAEAARHMLAAFAPARCHLYEINFSDAALIRNGFARRDGTYSRGSV